MAKLSLGCHFYKEEMSGRRRKGELQRAFWMKILKLKSVTLASTVVANAFYVCRPVNRQKKNKILHADELFQFVFKQLGSRTEYLNISSSTYKIFQSFAIAKYKADELEFVFLCVVSVLLAMCPVKLGVVVMCLFLLGDLLNSCDRIRCVYFFSVLKFPRQK